MVRAPRLPPPDRGARTLRVQICTNHRFPRRSVQLCQWFSLWTLLSKARECIRWTRHWALCYCSDALYDDARYVVNIHSLYEVEVCETCSIFDRPAVLSSRLQTNPVQDPESGRGAYTTQPAVQCVPPAIPDYDIWSARDGSGSDEHRPPREPCIRLACIPTDGC